MGGCNGGDGVKNRKVMVAFLRGGCTLVHEKKKRLGYKTNSSTNQHIIFININLCTCGLVVLRKRVNRMGALDFVEVGL